VIQQNNKLPRRMPYLRAFWQERTTQLTSIWRN